jgi:hypothetical protein
MSTLHDLGVGKDPKTLKHLAHTMTFELFGGFLAYDHLYAVSYPSVDDALIGEVVELKVPSSTPPSSTPGTLSQLQCSSSTSRHI